MTPRTKTLLQKLGDAEWFSHVGTGVIDDVVRAKSWKQAIKSCLDVKWLKARLGGGNAISVTLLEKARDRYMQLNDVIDDLIPVVEKMVKRKMKGYRKRFDLPEKVEETVSWHMLYIGVESECLDVVGPGFYSRLAELYLAGYFPCGWKGRYPKGQMIVY